MFIILYDPDGILNRFALVTWFYSRFKRWPQRMHEPGRYGTDLWFVAFVRPEEYAALPHLPTPLGDNPYRDPVDGEDSPLFREVLTFLPKLPPWPWRLGR